MSSETSSCTGFFQEHTNTALSQYFQQLNSAPENMGRSNSESGNDGAASMDNHRSSVSSLDSVKSGNSNAQWNNMQQQQQQHHQQQQLQQQQQHNHQQQQQQQHNHQQQQQQQHNQQHHQQHQQQQQQQQLHQQQQPNHQQHNHHTHPQLSALSHPLNSPNTNPQSIFGTGNFHYKTNNSWSIPALSCYQRLYNENSQYQRNFNSTETASTVPTGCNAAANAANAVNTANVGNAVAGAAAAQHMVNAVAAAVIATEHQNHLNSLKARFQPSTSGKSTSNSKEVICGDDKYKEEGDLWNVEAQTAFLGPNLWDKTLPYDADLKVTQYADLDEFLSENNIPDSLPGTHLGHSSGLGHRSVSLGHAAGLSLDLGHITAKRERSPSPSDCISPDTLNPPSPAESTFSFASSGRDFDPRTRAFSDEELKPQPMIKKSRKQFVPDELKDDKYWARRRKNNIAAKRSRDARRQKENQIAMRARYLEKENSTLHQEVEQLKQENMDLRARLSKFQDV